MSNGKRETKVTLLTVDMTEGFSISYGRLIKSHTQKLIRLNFRAFKRKCKQRGAKIQIPGMSIKWFKTLI
jgi:hypothetical protein